MKPSGRGEGNGSLHAPGERNQYEHMVRRILEQRIQEECADAALNVFHNRAYRGQSGHAHEIDVSAELVVGGCRLTILIECKQYRQRVATDDVLNFVGRVRDIGAHKGIIVTTVGFQEGAKKIAEAAGIALVFDSERSISWEVVTSTLVPGLYLAAREPNQVLNLKDIPRVVVEPFDAGIQLPAEDPRGSLKRGLSRTV